MAVSETESCYLQNELKIGITQSVILVRMFVDVVNFRIPIVITVGKPRTDSVPPTMQSQIPKSRDVTLFFLDMTLYK